MKLFTLEDFRLFDDYGDVDRKALASRIANALLEQWLKDAPTVYFNNDTSQDQYQTWGDLEQGGFNLSTCSKKAKLICIEEIGK